MKPSLTDLLGGSSAALAANVLPGLETAPPYLRGHVASAMLMLALAAQEAEVAADAMARAIAARRAILADARAQAPLPAEVAAAIDAALAEGAASLKLSDLAAAQARLNRALIAVHAWVEGADWADAAAFEARIWAELKTDALARKVELPPM